MPEIHLSLEFQTFVIVCFLPTLLALQAGFGSIFVFDLIIYTFLGIPVLVAIVGYGNAEARAEEARRKQKTEGEERGE